MIEPVITYHRLTQEDGADVFRPINRLDFGTIEGSGDSKEFEFYIWNNFNGVRDVPNLQLPKLSVQPAEPLAGSDTNNTEIIENGWVSIREYANPNWTKLGLDKDGNDLELPLAETLTGRWNDGSSDDPDTVSNFVRMVAKLTVPMNADVTMPYVFDLKITGSFV